MGSWKTCHWLILSSWRYCSACSHKVRWPPPHPHDCLIESEVTSSWMVSALGQKAVTGSLTSYRNATTVFRSLACPDSAQSIFGIHRSVVTGQTATPSTTELYAAGKEQSCSSISRADQRGLFVSTLTMLLPKAFPIRGNETNAQGWTHTEWRSQVSHWKELEWVN